ncbi:hypothetical protein [Bradyrhizobium prioriisuperbiae]|uniref:hypothetical protein n=1 Tax=Bradyrhizobium prioriisuperbiae TaxID=2854389 RepID=UPI0028EEEE0D|nr:hypothetical protein [Bradyrhizobium prioritasuperba]
MACELKDDGKTFPGRTLFTTSGSTCMRPTAVYLSPKHLTADKSASGNASLNATLDVVLWLHGYEVQSHTAFFYDNASKVREQVRDSNKDVILIAPWLGFRHSVKDGPKSSHWEGKYHSEILVGDKWGEQYLDEVLGALARLQNPDSPPKFGIRNLVIACHSGGGVSMRNLAVTLGSYRAQLKGCWGFDCLYTTKPADNDDASFWYKFASAKNACPVDIVFGPTTLPQSVKLDLMGRGIITGDGDKAVPARTTINGLSVRIGHDATSAPHQKIKVDDTDPAFLDNFTSASVPAKGRHKVPAPGAFLRSAIENLTKAVNFPGDIHYMIARGGFLDKLKNASFLG